MEIEGKSYFNIIDSMYKGRGVKNFLRIQKGNLIWLERMMWWSCRIESINYG